MAPPAASDVPTTFCWRLTGTPGPSLQRTFQLGEAVRSAVMRSGNTIGLARLPDSFHGGGRGATHDHAYWLPEDRDGDGVIDHITVYARSGIPQPVAAALIGTGSVWLDAGVDWLLVPIGLGRLRIGGVVGPSRQWTAATAYVTPLHRTDPTGLDRPTLAPEAQLRQEIASRGLPAPVTIVWREGIRCRDGVILASEFIRHGRGRRAPAGAWQGAPTIVFAETVAGPLAFGFGAHFGLGLMVPALASTPAVDAGRNAATLLRRGLPAAIDGRGGVRG